MDHSSRDAAPPPAASASGTDALLLASIPAPVRQAGRSPEALGILLTHARPHVAMAAGRMLGQIGDERALSILRTHLFQRPALREAAAEALAMSDEGTRRLVAAFEPGQPFAVRDEAFEALCRRRPVQSAALVDAVLDTPESPFRAAAIASLAHRPANEALPTLERLLKSEADREDASLAVAALDTEAAATLLLRAIDDAPADARGELAAQLAGMRNPPLDS